MKEYTLQYVPLRIMDVNGTPTPFIRVNKPFIYIDSVVFENKSASTAPLNNLALLLPDHPVFHLLGNTDLSEIISSPGDIPVKDFRGNKETDAQYAVVLLKNS